MHEQNNITIIDFIKQKEYDLSVRAKNVLKYASHLYTYMNELSVARLVKTRNCGLKSIKEIIHVYPNLENEIGSLSTIAVKEYFDKKAKEIIFLCGRYSAREALEMGWINKVVPDGSLEEETQAWVSRILEMSPQSLRISKTSLNFESDLLHSSYMHGIEMLSATYGSEELKEGMTSFMEKRKPDFNRFRK
ncbi:MAG TPA: enoyl-CoA hydratase-related protein [bacterium]|nr:enoyl-CoA hydratase-related protein [bacterium]